MAKPKKAPASKKPTRGVDFKKFKHKIGRKLPPPANSTKIQIKSKAIVLPEQSIAVDRSGLAVNNKGLTLRELLGQTSHHNGKTRNTALNGIRSLLTKHPSELAQHKLAIIEKLRERICDADRTVRDTLYHLMKTVVFPSSKEDLPLVMVYVFRAMTHMAADIRLMAFKFFELVVHGNPSTFFLYADKVLHSYVELFRTSHVHLRDTGSLKNALGGLCYCLTLLRNQNGGDVSSNDSGSSESRYLHAFENNMPKVHSDGSFALKRLEELVPILVDCFRESTFNVHSTPASECVISTLQCICLAVEIYSFQLNNPSGVASMSGPEGVNSMLTSLNKLWAGFPIGKLHSFGEKESAIYIVLNVKITEIFLNLGEWMDANMPIYEKFLDFFENIFLGQLINSKQSTERQLISLVPFIPRLVSRVTSNWKIRLLEAFTFALKRCRAESKLSPVYLSVLEQMLLPLETKDASVVSFDSCFLDMLSYKTTWVQELPRLLLQLGNRHPTISKSVLNLILRVGQCASPNSSISSVYDDLWCPLLEFYGREGTVETRAFIMLPLDCQELAISCLYYCTNLNLELLKSLAYCCLCDTLDLFTKLRIIEVLHSIFKAGRVRIAYYIAFLITLVMHAKVSPAKSSVVQNDDKLSSRGVFQCITRHVCSCLSEIGDKSVVLKLIYGKISNEVPFKFPLENMRGLLTLILSLYSKPSTLSDKDTQHLSNWLFSYLVETASIMPAVIDIMAHSDHISVFQYFVRPCIILFSGDSNLLAYVLMLVNSQIVEYDASTGSTFDIGSAPEAQRRAHAIIFLLTFMYNEAELEGMLLFCVESLRHIFQSMHKLLASFNFIMSLEERYTINMAFLQLKAIACKLHGWSQSDLEAM